MYSHDKKRQAFAWWDWWIVWGKRVNSDDWVDLWPRGSNRTGVDIGFFVVVGSRHCSRGMTGVKPHPCFCGFGIQEWDAFSNEALRGICRRRFFLGGEWQWDGWGCGSGMVGVVAVGWLAWMIPEMGGKISDSWVGYERHSRRNKIRAWTNLHNRSGTKSSFKWLLV